MHYAIKRLRKTDLTLFDFQFKRLQALAREAGGQGSKQKAFNLDAVVFVDIAFPAAKGDGTKRKFPLPVSIYGPGNRAQAHTVTRKVISPGGGGKNWRLNGELIPDPDFDPARYHSLQPGDLAILAMEGDTVPTAISIILISRTEEADQKLFERLDGLLRNGSMIALADGEIAALAALVEPEHPLRELSDPELDDALEQAALGSFEAVLKLKARPSVRRMTFEALRDAKRHAEAIGAQGEVLVDAWLRNEVRAGRLRSSSWVSDTNAVNPWDFEIVEPDGTLVRVEVKSTRGPFSRKIHMSQAEVAFAAEKEAPRTDIYRLFDMVESEAKLRIAKDFRPKASEIIGVVAGLGGGVVPDSYTIAPDSFGPWSGDIAIAEGDFDEEE